MGVFRLIYVSSPPPGLDDDGLVDLVHDIRSQCLSHNSHEHLTGVLAYSLQAFIQSLEGEESRVLDLYARIKTDPRHSDVQQILGVEVKGRAFPDWSMAFVPMEPPALLRSMPAREVLRFLIHAEQFCQGVRTLPGRGLPPEARLHQNLKTA